MHRCSLSSAKQLLDSLVGDRPFLTRMHSEVSVLRVPPPEGPKPTLCRTQQELVQSLILDFRTCVTERSDLITRMRDKITNGCSESEGLYQGVLTDTVIELWIMFLLLDVVEETITQDHPDQQVAGLTRSAVIQLRAKVLGLVRSITRTPTK